MNKTGMESGAKYIKAPTMAALPLPPLKPIGNIQLWPTTVNTTASIGMKGCWFDNDDASQAAKKPLPISIINTIVPEIFPRRKNVFDAPTFLLPSFDISIPFILPAMKAVGIEPIR